MYSIQIQAYRSVTSSQPIMPEFKLDLYSYVIFIFSYNPLISVFMRAGGNNAKN